MTPSNMKRSHSPFDNSQLKSEHDEDELNASQQSPQQYTQQFGTSDERCTTGHKRRSRRHKSKTHHAESEAAQEPYQMNVQNSDEQNATQALTNHDGSSQSTSSLSNDELADLFTEKSDKVVTAFNQSVPMRRTLVALDGTIREALVSLYDLVSSTTREDQTSVQNLQGLLDAQRQENQELQQDLADLRLQVATFSRMPGQVSDTELKEQMEDIWQQACHWIGTNFRKLKIVVWDGQNIPELSETSKTLLGDYLHILVGSSHSRVLKVGRVIVAIEITKILSHYFFGIDRDGEFGGIIRLAEASKAGDADFEEWRARTAQKLNHVNAPELREAISVKAVVIRTDLDLLFRELFGAPESEVRMRHLAEIIDKSIKLGHVCAAQRSRYRFGMPKMDVQGGIPFDPCNMQTVAGPDLSESSKSVVKMAVFPWLVKYDDNPGSKTCFITISKAKVVCEVE